MKKAATISAWGPPVTKQNATLPLAATQPKSIAADISTTPIGNNDKQRTKPRETPEAARLRDMIALAGGPEELLKQIRKAKYERNLYEFVKEAWRWIDPSEFVDSWAAKSLCKHLEAVTHGKIRFFLANYPPRCGKTLITSVIWPVWVWIQTQKRFTAGPQVRILGASYGQDLALRASDNMRTLVNSPWFQSLWGDVIKIKEGSDTKSDWANTSGGSRQATSVTGRLLGFGGDIIIVDDPHNTDGAESGADREAVLRGWHEIAGTRMNDPKQSAIVVIMQRLHEADVSGDILQTKSDREWVHLMIPNRHDSSRHCITYLPGHNEPFWEDPRTYDGEYMWPERLGEKETKEMETELGPYMASGRLQQSPHPKGGGIIKREWWQVWPPLDTGDMWVQNLPDKFGVVAPRIIYPDFDFIVGSIDTAYTEKEENDWSACTVWGTFSDPKTHAPKIMLISAWRARLTLNDLVQRILKSASRKNLEWDACLIENKASGISVFQELKRLMRPGAFALHKFDPKHDGGGDKTARLYAAQPTFAAGLIYAPQPIDGTVLSWAELVIDECEQAPKGKWRDLADTCAQAIIWLRKRGLARMSFEHEEDIRPRAWKGQQEPLYDV